MQLTKKILIQGEIVALSGLMIGGSNTAMGIGGPDKVVIRNPVNNQPYIPGSSLKGKMRSLIEIANGTIGPEVGSNVKNGPDNNIDNTSTLLFGTTNKDTSRQRPSRIIVRDSNLLNPDDLAETELPFTEAKTEVVIDRITSAAMPRTFERVPAGARFQLDIVLNIFDDDQKEKELITMALKGLQLLQDDYLGGGGSRGNGHIKLNINSIKERSVGYYKNEEEEKSLNIPEYLQHHA